MRQWQEKRKGRSKLPLWRWILRKSYRYRPLFLTLGKKRRKTSQEKKTKEVFKYSGDFRQHWIFRDASMLKICIPNGPPYHGVGTFPSGGTGTLPGSREVLENIVFKHINESVLISSLNDLYFLCANAHNSDNFCREDEITWQRHIKPGMELHAPLDNVIAFVLVDIRHKIRSLPKKIAWIVLLEVMPKWRGHNFGQLLLDKVLDALKRENEVDAMLPFDPSHNLGYSLHNSTWIAEKLHWIRTESSCQESGSICGDCGAKNYAPCWLRKLAATGRWDPKLTQSILAQSHTLEQ